ncbi:MAG: flagellar hook-length control protein FliK [Geminicoccaceae bacterium]|nr:flagellar hook-length control protein FliK [Geminicoccaceae bacterium]
MIDQTSAPPRPGPLAAAFPNAATGEAAFPDLFAALLASLLPPAPAATGVLATPAGDALSKATGDGVVPPEAPDATPALDLPTAANPPGTPNQSRLAAFLTEFLQVRPMRPAQPEQPADAAPPVVLEDLDPPAGDAVSEPTADQQLMAFWLVFQAAPLPATGGAVGQAQATAGPAAPSRPVDGAASPLALPAGDAGAGQGIEGLVQPPPSAPAGAEADAAPAPLAAGTTATPSTTIAEQAPGKDRGDAGEGLPAPDRAGAEALRPLFATTLGTTVAADHAHRAEAMASVARPAHPIPLVDLPVEIVHAVREGIDRLEVRLHPEELGGVDVTVEVGRDQRAHVVIAAERPETLELLQRDTRQIERVLAAQGLQLGGGIEMNLRQQGDRHAGGEGRFRGGRRPVNGVADEPAALPGAARRVLLDRLYDIQA